MNLYLVRHAVAHGRDAERWPDDSRRPLTPEGEEKFRMAARGLEEVVSRVERVLSSSFYRAWRTAEVLSEQSRWPYPEELPELEPDLPPHKILPALGDPGTDSIALVGHRPSLNELASYPLCGSSEGLDVKIKKGGVLCVRFDGPPALGAGKLQCLLSPKVLRALGQSTGR